MGDQFQSGPTKEKRIGIISVMFRLVNCCIYSATCIYIYYDDDDDYDYHYHYYYCIIFIIVIFIIVVIIEIIILIHVFSIFRIRWIPIAAICRGKISFTALGVPKTPSPVRTYIHSTVY